MELIERDQTLLDQCAYEEVFEVPFEKPSEKVLYKPTFFRKESGWHGPEARKPFTDMVGEFLFRDDTDDTFVSREIKQSYDWMFSPRPRTVMDCGGHVGCFARWAHTRGAAASQAAWRAENDAMRERGLAYRNNTMDGFMGAHIEKEYAWMMEARWHEARFTRMFDPAWHEGRVAGDRDPE